MEHRYSIRKKLAIHVLFYKHGVPVQSGQSLDLGLGGIFVGTRPFQWQKNECIEVELVSRRGAKLRLSVLVVHQREEGIGLMFDTVSKEQRKQLRDILFNATQTASFALNTADIEHLHQQVA